MKKLLALILICGSLTSAAQTKDTSGKKAKEVKADTTDFVLLGKFQDFQLLFTAVVSPGDVTPNQIQALAAWVRKIQVLPKPQNKN
jgi:hypothetical protein